MQFGAGWLLDRFPRLPSGEYSLEAYSRVFLLMLVASGLATFGSIWSIKASKYPVLGFVALGIFVLAAIIGSVMQGSKPKSAAE